VHPIDYFDLYTQEFGWSVIPAFPNSKLPVGRRWNDGYSVAAARRYVAAHPKCNLGILLGDIVDVEGDTAEANALLAELTHGCTPPTYQSVKSTHRLFRTPDRFLTSIRFDGIEFRGHRHHSLLPPSRRPGGVAYQWLTAPGPVPAMPPALLALYQSHRKRVRQDARPGFVRPVCALCEAKPFVHQKRFDLEVACFSRLGERWTCQSCRHTDVRAMCRQVRKDGRRRPTWSPPPTSP
jgi:hypothetical protein